MSEPKIVVERIFRDNTDMVEYRVRICSTHAVDYDVDERVPTKYLAAYVVNSLREYIQSATLDEEVIDRFELFRSNKTYTCPACGRTVNAWATTAMEAEKQVIRDAISWAKDDYEDSEEGRKQFVTDLMQVCADYVSDILEGWGWTNGRVKPCPLCGKSAIVDIHLIEKGFSIDDRVLPDWWTCSIICSKCPCQIIGGGNSKFEAKHNAIRLWNRRV